MRWPLRKRIRSCHIWGGCVITGGDPEPCPAPLACCPLPPRMCCSPPERPADGCVLVAGGALLRRRYSSTSGACLTAIVGFPGISCAGPRHERTVSRRPPRQTAQKPAILCRASGMGARGCYGRRRTTIASSCTPSALRSITTADMAPARTRPPKTSTGRLLPRSLWPSVIAAVWYGGLCEANLVPHAASPLQPSATTSRAGRAQCGTWRRLPHACRVPPPNRITVGSPVDFPPPGPLAVARPAATGSPLPPRSGGHRPAAAGPAWAAAGRAGVAPSGW